MKFDDTAELFGTAYASLKTTQPEDLIEIDNTIDDLADEISGLQRTVKWLGVLAGAAVVISAYLVLDRLHPVDLPGDSQLEKTAAQVDRFVFGEPDCDPVNDPASCR